MIPGASKIIFLHYFTSTLMQEAAVAAQLVDTVDVRVDSSVGFIGRIYYKVRQTELISILSSPPAWIFRFSQKFSYFILNTVTIWRFCPTP
jgi:hypothetical protein